MKFLFHFSLQLPNENWEPFEADKKIKLSQCTRQEIGVKFNYLSLETGETEVDKKENVETLGSELIHRGQSSEVGFSLVSLPLQKKLMPKYQLLRTIGGHISLK